MNMLRLYVKDNTSGRVHEYGTNQHDALILQNDGSLHYENLQCCAGTMFPEEGYSFCNEDGTIPKWDKEYGAEPYIDIGGEFYNKPTTNADRIRSMSDEELAEFIYRCEMSEIDYAKTFCDLCNGQYECGQCRLDWLKQPAE